jgi:1,2-diacylglycerol 3-beta-galactosyltransferase
LIRPLAKGLNLFSKKMMQYYGSKHPLIQFIDEQKPDVVISTSSFLNAHLSYAIDKTSSSPVFIVLMSDFDEAFDVMWSNGTSSTHYIIKEGAALLNQVNDPNVHKIGSLCVHPKFKSTGFSKKEWKKRLGLNGEMITIFCSFGGYGSFEMLELFDILRKKTNVHPIFITGNNEELYKRLTAQKIDHITVLSFTNHIEDWMRGSDLFVGKPGPGSVYEAIHTGLPLFLRGGIGVLKQEQGVLNWVVNNRFGEEWKDLKEFEIKLDEVIEKLNIYEKNILSSNTPFGTDQAIETILKIFHLRHGEGDGTTK